MRLCVAVDCPAWPFRMGKNPWNAKRQLSEEDRARRAAQLRRLRQADVPEPEVAPEGTQTPGGVEL